MGHDAASFVLVRGGFSPHFNFARFMIPRIHYKRIAITERDTRDLKVFLVHSASVTIWISNFIMSADIKTIVVIG